MTQVSAAARALAQHIYSHVAGVNAKPDALIEAAERIEARLRWRMSQLIGLIGYTTLITRALRLAQDEIPALEYITVNLKAEEEGLSGIRDFVEAAGTNNDDLRAVEAGLIAILAHVIGLLSIFIGEDLALRLTREAWPALGHNQTGLEG